MNRLSISNIAWDPVDDTAIAALLSTLEIDAIDIAPGKYFPNIAGTTASEIIHVKEWWLDRGIEIIGMQALLFGTSNLNLFGPPESQRSMLLHLSHACRIGAGLGARRLVFGSPRNRDRSTLSDEQVVLTAIDFFNRLGDIAASAGLVVCLEPNPPCYGANFMTTSAETLRVVEAVGHPAIKMQFDTGALTTNGEDPDEVLQACAPNIAHIHLSEPALVPIGDVGTDHAKISSALKKFMPDQFVTVEMLLTKDEAPYVSIERALNHAIRNYRDGSK